MIAIRTGTPASGMSYDPHPQPDEAIELEEMRHALREAVKNLSEQERHVLALRFGLETSAHTLREIAAQKNLSPERIRQIEQKALRRLRHPSSSVAQYRTGSSAYKPKQWPYAPGTIKNPSAATIPSASRAKIIGEAMTYVLAVFAGFQSK